MRHLLKLHRNVVPYIAALLTFMGVLLFADSVRQTTESLYIDKVELHQKQAKEAIRQSDQSKKLVKDLENRVEVLAAENVDLEKKLKSNKTKTGEAVRQTNTAKDSLKIAKTLTDSNVLLTNIVTHQDVVITSQAAEIKVLESQKINLTAQIAVKDSVNALLEADNQRLSNVVKTIPPTDKCANKFLFCKLNKPSRTTSFVTGIVTAVAVGVVIR